MRKNFKLAITLIFLLVLGIRLFFAFSTPNFTIDQSYTTLEQINNIKQNQIPSFHDPLGTKGEFFMFPSLFYYILTFFNLFLPLSIVGKLIPQIFASSLVFIIYLISKKITKNKNIALLTAGISAFLPIFFKSTITNISVFTLAIPLFFLTIFFFMNITKHKKYISYFLITLILLILTHPIALFLILCLIGYLILIKAVDLKENKKEMELIMFSTLLTIWFTLLIFKNAFLSHGYSTIWQNVPNEILSNYFFELGILESMYAIGIIPLIFGSYIIYKYLIKRKKRDLYIFGSIILCSFILLWLKLIRSNESLMILGASLIIVSSQYYDNFLKYMSKTKIHYKKIYLFILIIILILTSFLPCIDYANKQKEEAVTDKEIQALNWLNENTPEDSIIASLYTEGDLMTSTAKRKALINQNFLTIKNSNQRYQDHKIIFSSPFSITALELLEKYNINYIYFSPRTKEFLHLEKIPYVYEECFPLVYDNTIKIYQVRCTI